ncbi:MAG TPA: MaoC family dehydratase [Acidimicrobiia bacterium]|nr:MaoC family dehydratase [Acidimicrobiia bacterium]
MTTKAEQALELIQKLAGSEEGVGDWFTIDQDRINAFAEVTEDRQFIHIDPERAKDTPFGTTIAHGFLTLSMLSHLVQSIRQDPAAYDGAVMGINYGFEKVRFISPVKVDARIRARSEIVGAELKDVNTIQVTRRMTIEIDGEAKPACVADWLTRTMYA